MNTQIGAAGGWDLNGRCVLKSKGARLAKLSTHCPFQAFAGRANELGLTGDEIQQEEPRGQRVHRPIGADASSMIDKAWMSLGEVT